MISKFGVKLKWKIIVYGHQLNLIIDGMMLIQKMNCNVLGYLECEVLV